MKLKLIVTITIILAFCSSCSKWLEVQPESEVSEENLFSTEYGFEESLNGVYSICAGEQLYGRELTVGTPEALAQNYTLSANDPYSYRQTGNFNFKNGDFIKRKDNIWKGLYSAIVNCNLILSNIDAKKTIFSGHNYEIVKGEALALRAYIHFDLLRMFAQSYLRNPSGRGIPYVTTYSKDVTSLSNVTESINLVIKDLEEAKSLLVNDPIRSAAYKVGYPTVTDTLITTEENSPVLFLQNRRHHLNYYAVCGTLARVYLYKNDKAKALENALAVINGNKFPWTLQSDFLAFENEKKDRILYKELVFGWYLADMSKKLNDEWFRTGNSGIYIQKEAAGILYEVGGVGSNDLRYKQWFNDASNQSGNPVEIHKYRRNPLSDEKSANLHYMMAPALRLSEMYYIAAECTYESSLPQAASYINTVRTVRGIGASLNVTTGEQFITELLKECRKEWYAEGQMFYMYKRLNRPVAGQGGTVIAPSDNVFVFPLPDDEILYGGR